MFDPNCKACLGTGSVPVTVKKGPPVHRRCECTLHHAILANVERGMRGLSKARTVPWSPLLGREDEDTWVTASPEWMLPHLRHVAVRQVPTWGFAVASDADLITAWLATVALEGAKIYDADVFREATEVSLVKMTLVDLIEPPALLIIRLGVKTAPNRAMADVFMEALAHRAHVGRPTWVWDEPNNRITDGSNRCHSLHAVEHVSGWEHVDEATVPLTPGGKAPRAGNPNQPTTANIRNKFFK